MRRWYEHRIPPPVIDLACAGAMAWLAGAVPAARLWPPGGAWWVWVLALGLATVGALVALAGLIEFRRARTTFNPLAPQRARTVVTSGVYRHTRNPMYLGCHNGRGGVIHRRAVRDVQQGVETRAVLRDIRYFRNADLAKIGIYKPGE